MPVKQFAATLVPMAHLGLMDGDGSIPAHALLESSAVFLALHILK
jgi:hypothetical protein